jgi:hypothetical protein
VADTASAGAAASPAPTAPLSTAEVFRKSRLLVVTDLGSV